MRMLKALPVFAVLATALMPGAAQAIPVTVGDRLGIDFDLGLTGTSVTSLGYAYLFNGTVFDPGESLRISVFEEEGGALLGQATVINTFPTAVANIGTSLGLNGGLMDGIGYAEFEVLSGVFDLIGANFNSFAPVFQQTGVSGTNLRLIGGEDPGNGTDVPEPATIGLLLAGLAGAAGASRARRRRTAA